MIWGQFRPFLVILGPVRVQLDVNFIIQFCPFLVNFRSKCNFTPFLIGFSPVLSILYLLDQNWTFEILLVLVVKGKLEVLGFEFCESFKRGESRRALAPSTSKAWLLWPESHWMLSCTGSQSINIPFYPSWIFKRRERTNIMWKSINWTSFLGNEKWDKNGQKWPKISNEKGVKLYFGPILT